MSNWFKRLFGGSGSSSEEASEPATAPEPPAMPAEPAPPPAEPAPPPADAGAAADEPAGDEPA